MFSKFDTQIHSDEQATRYEEEQELLRTTREEAEDEQYPLGGPSPVNDLGY